MNGDGNYEDSVSSHASFYHTDSSDVGRRQKANDGKIDKNKGSSAEHARKKAGVAGRVLTFLFRPYEELQSSTAPNGWCTTPMPHHAHTQLKIRSSTVVIIVATVAS